jgi:AhpD family alkylhydroperoxidase
MNARLDYIKVAPGAARTISAMERFVAECGVERALVDLIKLRASQINGCAYCIDMHWKDTRATGGTDQRLYELNAWRETPFYTDRERAALAWTEAVTLLTEGHVPDAVYAEARGQVDEQELVALTLAIAAINAWNRMNVSFRTVPGSYQPPATRQPTSAHAPD